MTDTYVALLRGVNVGGKNRLPMQDLAALFTDAGCSHVRTYIQSGNVVFAAKAAVARRVPDLIAKAVARDFELTVPVVIRTADELRRVAKVNPFLRAGADPTELHVGFLLAEPEASRVAALDPNRSLPDEFKVLGREIYLRLPNGVARSKLTNAWLDSKLVTTTTIRNWNTVTRLLELVATSG